MRLSPTRTPFRMPDFFLISGLFLARAIDKDWRSYLDRRVLHFAYFYVLWLTIQLAFKAPMIAQESGWLAVLKLYALSFIDPFGHLWFIYLLPIFFVLTKLLRKVSPLIVWPAAAALEIAHIDSEWTLILEFPRRFVYFYSGYLFAAHVFKLAATARAWPKLSLTGLAAWAVLNGVFVVKGWAALPFISLALGYLGIAALVSVSALAANSVLFDPLRYLGEKSLYIYLAFILPMAAARIVLFKTGIVGDLGVISLLVTAAGLAGALVHLLAVARHPLFRIPVRTAAAFPHRAAEAARLAARTVGPRGSPHERNVSGTSRVANLPVEC